MLIGALIPFGWDKFPLVAINLYSFATRSIDVSLLMNQILMFLTLVKIVSIVTLSFSTLITYVITSLSIIYTLTFASFVDSTRFVKVSLSNLWIDMCFLSICFTSLSKVNLFWTLNKRFPCHSLITLCHTFVRFSLRPQLCCFDTWSHWIVTPCRIGE